jgi:hypothetical protein
MLEFSGKDSYWGNSKGKKKNKTCRLITKSLLGIVLYERLLSLSLSLSLSWEGWWQRRCFTSVPFVRCLPKGEKLKLKIQLKKTRDERQKVPKCY